MTMYTATALYFKIIFNASDIIFQAKSQKFAIMNIKQQKRNKLNK